MGARKQPTPPPVDAVKPEPPPAPPPRTFTERDVRFMLGQSHFERCLITGCYYGRTDACQYCGAARVAHQPVRGESPLGILAAKLTR